MGLIRLIGLIGLIILKNQGKEPSLFPLIISACFIVLPNHELLAAADIDAAGGVGYTTALQVVDGIIVRHALAFSCHDLFYARGHHIHLVLAALGLRGDLEERVCAGVVDVHGLRRAVARAEH